jgi:WD40 repeat protein
LPNGAIGRLGTTRFRHSGEITAIAFSPNGKTLLAGSAQGDDSVSLWDVASGARRLRLPIESGTHKVAYSPDGKRLAAVDGLFHGDGGVVHIWDAATGMKLGRLPVKGSVGGLCFSPTSKLVAIHTTKAVLVWGPGSAPRVQTKHKGQGHAVTYSPDGKRIAGGVTYWRDPDRLEGATEVLHIWDAATGKLVHSLRGHEDDIRTLAFSPDGRWLASGGWRDKNTVRLWDLDTGKELPALEKRQGAAFALCFIEDGKVLLAADGEGRARGWRLPGGKALRHLPVLEAVPHHATAVAFSPDGKQLAMGSWPGAAGRANTIHVWDLATGKQGPRQEGHEAKVRGLAFSADGKRLASCAADGMILWWPQKRRRAARIGSRRDNPGVMALSSDGTVLAASEEHEQTIRLWDTANAKERARLTWPVQVERGHPLRQEVAWLRFSPDGKTLAAAEKGQTWLRESKLRLWEVPEPGRGPRANPPVLIAPSRALFPGHFSRDGKTLTVGTSVGVLRWNLATRKQTHRAGREVPLDDAVGVTLSPDGELLAVGTHFGALSLWKTTDDRGDAARLLPTSPDTDNSIRTVAFSPDGRILASADRNGVIRFWDVRARKELAQRRGHTGSVNCLVFSPDGNTLASGGADTTILLWDIAPIEKLASEGWRTHSRSARRKPPSRDKTARHPFRPGAG